MVLCLSNRLIYIMVYFHQQRFGSIVCLIDSLLQQCFGHVDKKHQTHHHASCFITMHNSAGDKTHAIDEKKERTATTKH